MPSRPPPGVALAIAALAAFTVWISWQAKTLERSLNSIAETIALLHKPAPDFALKSLDGRTVSLADFRGKQKVVVSFWASWCGPCRMEMPALRSFYQKTHKADADYEIVAVSIDDDRDAAEEYATRSKMPFPVLLDAAQKAAGAYGVDSIPRLFVIDRSGTVTFGQVGYTPALELQLARELGIKNYTLGVPQLNANTGAPDGNASH
jgi:peroxiredoxin